MARRPAPPAPLRHLEPWFRKYPSLRLAYHEAKRRFGRLKEVYGIGIGRKFSERKGKYGPAPKKTGGFAVKIFVKEKRETHELQPSQRIPRSISVHPKGRSQKTRVLLDVVAAGTAKQEGALQQGSGGWPTAKSIMPGRRFSFGNDVASRTSGAFQNGEAELGTTGALIEKNGDYWATSAGHVFVRTCAGRFNAPRGLRALGVDGNQWTAVPDTSFFPATISRRGMIRDAMLFLVPPAFVPSPRVTWPTDFRGELSTQEDIQAALMSEDSCGFIWVERSGSSVRADIDLQAGVPFFDTAVTCEGSQIAFSYGFVWQMRFMTAMQTIGGDSGAPVFLNGADGSLRLLGFHFLAASDQGTAYAVDAKGFLRDVAGELNTDYRFA
jgi:hypothetical protein